MGTTWNEGVTSFCSFSGQDRRFAKHIHDNVHGNIYLDPFFLHFVDTEQFQRLRDLKQLGLCHMVYPGAVHSRFEHSLGVYRLASEAVHTIKAHQGSEINIEHNDIKTVKLAGLLHDVGHGPFSHLFEREFLPRVLKGSKWSHEEMSVKMIDYIVDAHHIEIDAEILKNVKEMVLASSANASQKTSSEKRFLYDIVANGRNGTDVDKFDYIVRDSRACGLGCNLQFQRLMETMRVMGDEICYRAKEYLTIHNLFVTRADLHRTVYTHAKVKAIELMVVDALTLANGELSISETIHEPAKFWKLDDSILRQIETSDKQELKEARDLILSIRRRDLYQVPFDNKWKQIALLSLSTEFLDCAISTIDYILQFCNEFSVPKDKLEHFKDITPQNIVCSQRNGGTTLKEEDIAVSIVKIDLTRGRSNPMESINFFQDYESDYKFPIPEERISHLLPAFCQDTIVRVYSKKPELVGAVSEAFENYQVKTYGMKAQVHDTPEKKKRGK
ncbi:deoxynucleoside triphosphate triphosphohydrolase SAMHD1 homolog isoform X1 [Durio zibethinus]|uniref:Deoxynucleoside triphosphate triphosphohydrolase SAMHD1 homolog isoform X1 n=1 Tax=Durio zibethinus TaxID=66656 RepID=A0A6P5XE89_DURZI|nr:deoxynucleoside triphosphate triphosphohydrolase SAMHD1 homolog isoform X1 [Durio zibethinus]XP_022725972.1 deoxynucleoside triphosphate triphosphohydrolase SAMHD1 homolog isoform X1 [Durio zibethinus]